MSIEQVREQADRAMAALRKTDADDQAAASTSQVETPKEQQADPQKPEEQQKEFKPLNLEIDTGEAKAEPTEGDGKAELEAQLQRERVEAGRLRKANEELTKERERREELEKKIAELEASKRQESYLDMVPDDIKDVVDETVLKASGSVAENMIKGLRSEFTAEIESLKEQTKKSEQAVVEANVNELHRWVGETYPGLADETSRGGKLGDAWNQFLSSTDPVTGHPYVVVLNNAFSGNRRQGVQYVLDTFVQKVGVRRGEAGNTVAPSGTATSTDGREAQGDDRIYTESEYQQIMQDSLKLTQEERNAVVAKMQTAATQGRIIRG